VVDCRQQTADSISSVDPSTHHTVWCDDRWHDEISGGFNNSVDDLSCDQDNFSQVLQMPLSIPTWQDGYGTQIMYLHGLRVLWFYQDFVDCCGLLWIGSIAIHNKRATSKHARTRLSQDPTQDACHNANISNETFEQWQADVKKAFREKNCYALSLNDALEWQ